MWSTFVPFVPNSILPGVSALVAALLAVALVDFFLPINFFPAYANSFNGI